MSERLAFRVPRVAKPAKYGPTVVVRNKEDQAIQLEQSQTGLGQAERGEESQSVTNRMKPRGIASGLAAQSSLHSDDGEEDDDSVSSTDMQLDVDDLCEALQIAWTSRDVDNLGPRIGALREVLATKSEPPIRQVVEQGYATTLLGVLSEFWRTNTKLCFEALWALSEITCGEKDQSTLLVELGVLNLLSDIVLESEDSRCVSQAVCCMGNIAGNSILLQEAILGTGIANEISRRLNDLSSPVQRRREYASLAKSLCESFLDIERIRPLVAAAGACIARNTAEDSAVMIDSLAILRLCTDGRDNMDGLTLVHSLNVLPAVFEAGLSENPSPKPLFLALRIAMSFALSEEAAHHSAFIQSGGISFLAKVLDSNNKGLMRYVCWGVGGLAHGELTRRNALVMDEDILNKLVHIIEVKPDHSDCRAAIINVFSNLIDTVPIEVLSRWQTKLPIFQVLVHFYFTLPGALRNTARISLKDLLASPALLRCIRELRCQPRELLWEGFSERVTARDILQDEELEEQEAIDLIWLVLAKGIPERHFIGDLLKDNVSVHLGERLRGLQVITKLTAITTLSRLRMPANRPWLTMDLWRLVWTALIY